MAAISASPPLTLPTVQSSAISASSHPRLLGPAVNRSAISASHSMQAPALIDNHEGVCLAEAMMSPTAHLAGLAGRAHGQQRSTCMHIGGNLLLTHLAPGLAGAPAVRNVPNASQLFRPGHRFTTVCDARHAVGSYCTLQCSLATRESIWLTSTDTYMLIISPQIASR